MSKRLEGEIDPDRPGYFDVGTFPNIDLFGPSKYRP